MPPPENVYKVNVDAALSIENNIMGVGIVVWNSEGMFMAGKSVQLAGCLEPHRAELIEAREALLFAWDASFRRVILEGDATNVYSNIESVEDDLSYNGSILRDIVLYAIWFPSFRSSSISRERNRVADFLAHKAVRGESGIWLEDSPEDLIYLLNADLESYKFGGSIKKIYS